MNALDQAFIAAGWTQIGNDVWEHKLETPLPYGVVQRVQIYRVAGRVRGANLYVGDDQVFPFDSRRTVTAIKEFLAGVRYEVVTYNGRYPNGPGMPFGPSSVTVMPTRQSANKLFRKVNRDRAATVRKVGGNA